MLTGRVHSLCIVGNTWGCVHSTQNVSWGAELSFIGCTWEGLLCVNRHGHPCASERRDTASISAMQQFMQSLGRVTCLSPVKRSVEPAEDTAPKGF